MGEKSVQKKRYIVETARKVFVEKGFKKVTMKDIVEACDISRGGLYLYFESTSQIFLEVLKMESQEADDIFSDNITEDATAADILILFLKEQKKELLRKKDTQNQRGDCLIVVVGVNHRIISFFIFWFLVLIFNINFLWSG